MNSVTKKQEEIVGTVERITFHNPENGYTVAKIQQPKRAELTCIVGIFFEIQPGETIRCFGNWKYHLVYGSQFEVEHYRTETPADVEGIQKYLGSGLIKGIGPVYAKRITDMFGIDTLNIIDTTPDMLSHIQGMGKARIAKITSCWQEQKSIRDLMIFLQKHGLRTSFAQKIFRAYGNDGIKIISENPYTLSRDIFGIGFKTADAMAEKLGMKKDHPLRIRAGIEFVLSELSNEGHTCYPLEEFLKEGHTLLEVDAQLIRDELRAAEQQDRIKIASRPSSSQNTAELFVWLKSLYFAEVGISRELWRIKKNHSVLRKIEVEKALEWVQEKLHITLAPQQKKAVAKAFYEKIQIITGGPGTGKSTITKAILTITEKLTQEIVLAAPTGRAAKRMSEITGHPAKTIHSLLEYDFHKGGFKRNREMPLTCDLAIIDEASMIDTSLMYHLLKALPDHCRLIIIGDSDQLPSVGPGNVLDDIIRSRMFSVTRLTEIFRQAAGSSIITNAHRIRQGIFPDISNIPQGDFFFIEQNDAEKIQSELVDLVVTRLPTKYQFDSIKDIQVLAPMKKGIVGIDQLNQSLQKALNRSEEGVVRLGRRFLSGDKVMQIRNNYRKEVFNGDIGCIKKIDLSEQQIWVEYEERLVEYDFSELDELVLAYAVSIHKYQGSESTCVIIPIHTSHFIMLRRNLLYTGATRGKKLIVLLGEKKALFFAVKNNVEKLRYTALKEQLTPHAS